MTEHTTRHAFLDTPIGTLTLIADDAALVEVWFPNHAEPDGGAGLDELDGAGSIPSTPVLRRASDQLDEYFAGTRTDVRRPPRPARARRSSSPRGGRCRRSRTARP